MKSVLVIDDVYLDRFVASQIITKFRFADKIILKESAMEALAYLQTFTDRPEELPELIFLDIRMPDVDGFGFLDRFNQLPEIITRQIAIFMLSSSSDPRDMKRATDNKHVKGFVMKPLDKEKLDKVMF